MPSSSRYRWPIGLMKATFLNRCWKLKMSPSETVVLPSFCFVAAMKIFFI